MSKGESQAHHRLIGKHIPTEVIDALQNPNHGKSIQNKGWAQHWMLGYQIKSNKLWRIGDSKSTRAITNLECVTQEEAKEMAHFEDKKNGHFGHDLIKILLLDQICSPKLNKLIVSAIIEYGQCRAFGGQYLAVLLETITQWHPWELLVGDYLSLPIGKGGFHTVGLYMDVYSQKISRLIFTTYSTTGTTIGSPEKICQMYHTPDVFMADRGSHISERHMKKSLYCNYKLIPSGCDHPMCHPTKSPAHSRHCPKCQPYVNQYGVEGPVESTSHYPS